MPSPSTISVHELSAGPDDFLKSLSFEIPAGQFVCVLGPNGSGKTTLLRSLSGLHPHKGSIRLDGVETSHIARKQFARQLAVVPPMSVPEFEFSVEEVVQTGRYPYRSLFPLNTKGERLIIEAALAAVGIVHLRSKRVTDLSSGEFQRVTIARALAQQTPVLLLDEPTAHLDLAHQIQVFELLAGLRISAPKTILCVSHDLNLAAEFADRLLLMSHGRIFADGTPAEVLTEANLLAVFGARVHVDMTPESNRPSVRIRRELQANNNEPLL